MGSTERGRLVAFSHTAWLRCQAAVQAQYFTPALSHSSELRAAVYNCRAVCILCAVYGFVRRAGYLVGATRGGSCSGRDDHQDT